jgi:glycosyltransferase involved in cell wall biosynthesis
VEKLALSHQESGTLDEGSSPDSFAPPSHPVENTQASSGGRPPLVTVIIPAYQCAQYITQGIDSVLAQSFQDYEIIVVNDGSPDTAELEVALRPYLDKIIYLQQANSGPSRARNAALRRARGRYVAFLDSDDYWAPDHLAKSVKMLESKPGLALVYCDCFLVRDGQPHTRVFLVQEQPSRVSFESLLLQSATISTSCTVASRQGVLAAGGFDESLVRCEDFDMWLRISFDGGRIAYHPDAEVYHRVHAVGLSADGLAMIKDRVRVYEKMATTLPVSREQRRIIRRMITKCEGDRYTEQLKEAMERRDYAAAREAAHRANAVESSWKLKLAMLGLRVAPRLFRMLNRSRSVLLQRRKYSKDSALQEPGETLD